MNRFKRRLWKRLDIRLSSIVFVIIFAWFGTFLLSLYWVQRERVHHSIESERERITAKVNSEMRMILASIVLKHEEALQITLQGLVRDLGLSSVDLSRIDGKTLHYTSPSLEEGQLVHEEFPLHQGTREFGHLRIEKTIVILPYASGPVGYWIVALLIIQVMLFWIIRRFLRSEVINPIREVISNSIRSEGKGVAVATHAEEIEDLSKLFVNMREANDQYHAQLIESEKRAVFGKVASQVSHDIRSPLSALEELLRSITKLPEQERILARRAINRIRDIAHLLLSKSRENVLHLTPIVPEKKIELIPTLVEGIVAEKRVQYQGKMGIEIESKLDSSAYSAFAIVDSKDFQRILSNLIDNAVEALPGKGHVVVSISQTANAGIEVSISDDGKGIPPDVLHKLQVGVQVTHGKENGNGLGFVFAKEKTQEWSGELTVQSIPGKGTLVRIVLPQTNPPPWFLAKLDLREINRVVILDDDPSIHQVWTNRLSDTGVKLVHFTDPNSLSSWIKENTPFATNIRFLLDYELIGLKKTGIDVAIETGICQSAILITSRFEEESIQARCVKAGIKIVPKPLATYVSIFSCKGEHLSPPDFVLIDDDEMIRLSWEISAQMAGVKLVCYSSPGEFLENVKQIPKETPIYVDVNLGNGVRGERVTKDLCEQGYKTLYLATGERPETIGEVPWVCKVIGKSPPFLNDLATT